MDLVDLAEQEEHQVLLELAVHHYCMRMLGYGIQALHLVVENSTSEAEVLEGR
jgi:hypothetical protein